VEYQEKEDIIKIIKTLFIKGFNMANGLGGILGGLLGGIGNLFGAGSSLGNITPTYLGTQNGQSTLFTDDTLQNADAGSITGAYGQNFGGNGINGIGSLENYRTSVPTDALGNRILGYQTKGGLGGFSNGYLMNNLPQLLRVGIAGLNYLDTKKQRKKDNMMAEWSARNKTIAANNNNKWSRGLQNTLEGKSVGEENERKDYIDAPHIAEYRNR